MQVRVPVAQKSHLQIVEQPGEPCFRIDNRRDHDHRSILLGNSVAHRQLGKLTGRHLRGDDQIEQTDHELADRQDHDRGHQPERAGGRPVSRGVHQKTGDADGNGDGHQAEIASRRVAERKPGESLAEQRFVANLTLEA
jgi:hypothetical protein